MKNRPVTVSVIIPCYNAAKYVPDTLASVFAQTRSDFEVIVVNDGSPDTPELERALIAYATRILYIAQENRGVAGARNTGIRSARGEYIAFLDSDDVWEPDYLAVQLATLEHDPTVDVVYPNVLICDDTLRRGRPSMDFNPSNGPVTFGSIVTRRCNVASCVTARRDVIMRAGLFDESLRGSEDFDLWLRLVKQGSHIAYHRKVLVRYRKRRGSLSADDVWMYQHILRVLDKAAQTLPLTPEERSDLALERTHCYATLRMHEAKERFSAGDYRAAIAKLTEANAILGQRKLAVIIRILRLAPRLLLGLYVARERVMRRVSTDI